MTTPTPVPAASERMTAERIATFLGEIENIAALLQRTWTGGSVSDPVADVLANAANLIRTLTARAEAAERELATERTLREAAEWAAKNTKGERVIELEHRAEAAEARAETARSSLQKISEHDIPRPVGEPWAKDGKPSKHDKCTHGNWMWADCDNCTAEFASNTLQGLHPRPAPMAEGERDR